MFAAMDRYMQYRLAEQDEDSVESFTDLLTNNNDKKNGRGPTQMHDIWGNRDVRDGKNAPINYENWHKVPDKYKVTMWRIIQEKFDIPYLAENWTMKTCGKELKNWKAYLKKTYYSETLSFEEQKKYKDKRVYDKQWEQLINYWATDDGKKKSATNKASRAKKIYNHTTGTKSFAQIRSAEVKLQEKEEINGDISKEKSMNDTYSEIMGKERYDDATSSQPAKRACTSHNKEPRRQLLFSCSSYDTPVVEVGEVVKLKSITNDPETVAIALVISKDSSKQVGGKELGDFYSEVIVQVPIKCDEQLIRAYGQFKKIGEVVGVPIAWPTTFSISEESHTQLDDSMM
ncbi:hypothetical protein F8388_026440 [Cannabis sativa]|uniref:Transposase Tnp1/En/Spm-like domain-containing protein n=1 Tax=Cannabis sativa TaxID=3483 RepID=A0A7J6EHL1_CANSA|nr:hypothetical protein G4B88_030023 [Cannabis sativa]KAF4381341.1 hypothetical protein F8388_026440 [Cannabis sativa]